MPTFSKDNPPPGEGVREFYRQQGREQERDRIVQLLENLLDIRTEATWSPVYILRLVKGEIDEA